MWCFFVLFSVFVFCTIGNRDGKRVNFSIRLNWRFPTNQLWFLSVGSLPRTASSTNAKWTVMQPINKWQAQKRHRNIKSFHWNAISHFFTYSFFIRIFSNSVYSIIFYQNEPAAAFSRYLIGNGILLSCVWEFNLLEANRYWAPQLMSSKKGHTVFILNIYTTANLNKSICSI